MCFNVFKGCENCSYTEDLGEILPILKRKRMLVCNSCQEGFMFQNGECIPCNITNCQKCKVENNQFKCIEPNYGYYIDVNGIIQKCEACHNCSLNNNKLICYQADYNAFIDKDGKAKFCSDEIENCNQCEIINSNVKCIFCNSDYELSGNKCVSIREKYNLTGCEIILNYHNGSYSCIRCEKNYFYVSNENICVPKTEKTKLCEKSISIKENNYYIYSCTECSDSGSLIKNLTGHYYCYELSTGDNDNYCVKFANLGTFEEPYYICEECKYGNYPLTIVEYGNQECTEVSEGYANNCIKYNKTKYISNYYPLKYNYKYNCTECMEDFALIFNDINGLMKCKFTCEVINCQKCENYSENICKICKSGYILNIISNYSFCVPMPNIYTPAPTIIFKDIFRYVLNGVYFLNGNKLFGPIFYLRGISRNDIDAKHSFLISTVFSRINSKNLRNLEEINFKTYCEFRNIMPNNFSNIKEVDYECFVDKGNSSLEEYNINSLNSIENKTELTLNVKGLENLVQKSPNLTSFVSSYDNRELDNYIEFYLEENTIEININNDTRNQTFIIKGQTNKNTEKNISCILTFINTNKTANCVVNAKNKLLAAMTCVADFSNFSKNYSENNFGFEEKEILDDENYFYLFGIKNIQFEYNINEMDPINETNIQSSIILDTNPISSTIISSTILVYSSIPITEDISTNIIINDSSSLTEILSTNLNINESNPLIPPKDYSLEEPGKVIFLGISNYIHIKEIKLGKFIIYFVPTKGKTNAEELIITFYIIYKRLFRILQSTKTETAKFKSINSDIKNIIKYNCSFNTSGEDINEIQVNSNNIYFVGNNISISSISPLAIKYMNNLQDCNNENIFDKNLYILNNSELVQNNKIFNITGELKENELNYKNINLEFVLLSENKDTKIENANCSIIKLDQNNNKYRLMCSCNKEMIGDINNAAFSLMENDNLLVLFKDNINYSLDYTKEVYQIYYKKSNKKGLSAGYIVLIILALLVAISIISIIIFLSKRKPKLLQNNDQITDNSMTLKSISTANIAN